MVAGGRRKRKGERKEKQRGRREKEERGKREKGEEGKGKRSKEEEGGERKEERKSRGRKTTVGKVLTSFQDCPFLPPNDAAVGTKHGEPLTFISK